jgi:uncharacterized hydrophobic protein (TIGR00341 family)
MTLRLVEIIFPSDNANVFAEIVESEETLGSWTDTLDGDLRRARVLVPANRTEALSDRVRRELGHVEGFRMILFAVEATVPVPKEEEKTEPEEAPKKKYSDRVSREELYNKIAGGAKLSKVYLLMVALSAVVAAIGLVRDNVAVVVGAMVIAPLLGPNVALALGTTLGDIPLAWRALKTNAAGVAVAFLLAVIAGKMIPVDLAVKEIASRTSADVTDVVLALAAGAAGALAYTSAVPASLVGVMVAVALIPPLVNAGLLAGAGYTRESLGALTLVLTNVACINLSGVLTFLAQRVRPRMWWEEKTARKATRRAIILWLLVLAVLLVVILRLWEIVGL